ncbi:MAG: enoyl-CoA hydratase/isomerase family protein [Chitinophagaceae bacterium]
MIHELNDGYVKVETHPGVTTIEFFHPQSNSLPGKILADLEQEIHSAGNDDKTKVIILRSGGESAFCAGAYFNELLAIKTAGQGQDFFRGFANVFNAMRKCPKFIIGRIHGNCVGGGVGLAAAVDYCIASDNVQVKLSELSIGLGPFVVGPVVERKIGNAAFGQLAIDASMWRNADWAKRKGLFAEVHPGTESMDESIERLANTLVHANPESMKEMKKMLWRGTEHWDELLREKAAISGKLVLSEFTRNAIIAFKNRVRKPKE